MRVSRQFYFLNRKTSHTQKAQKAQNHKTSNEHKKAQKAQKAHKKHKNANKRTSDFLPLRCFLNA